MSIDFSKYLARNFVRINGSIVGTLPGPVSRTIWRGLHGALPLGSTVATVRECDSAWSAFMSGTKGMERWRAIRLWSGLSLHARRRGAEKAVLVAAGALMQALRVEAAKERPVASQPVLVRPLPRVRERADNSTGMVPALPPRPRKR